MTSERQRAEALAAARAESLARLVIEEVRYGQGLWKATDRILAYVAEARAEVYNDMLTLGREAVELKAREVRAEVVEECATTVERLHRQLNVRGMAKAIRALAAPAGPTP